MLLQPVQGQEKVALDSVVTQGRFYPMTMNKVDENYTIIIPKEIQQMSVVSVDATKK